MTGTSGASLGLFTVMVPTGSGYTINAWAPGVATGSQLTGQSVTATVTKTITLP